MNGPYPLNLLCSCQDIYHILNEDQRTEQTYCSIVKGLITCMAFRDGSIIYYKRYFSTKSTWQKLQLAQDFKYLIDCLLVKPQKKKGCSILAGYGFLNSKAETLISDPEKWAKMKLEFESVIPQINNITRFLRKKFSQHM